MDNKLVLLIFVFLLIFSAFTGSIFFARQKNSVRAAKSLPVSEKSLCITGTLTSPVNQSVEITCVARDSDSHSVEGSQCCFVVATGPGTVSPKCLTADSSGMAKANLISAVSGITKVDCLINGSISAGSASVEFK